MIDVTVHLEKLELLKEYMGLWIDDRVYYEINPKTITFEGGATFMIMMPNYFELPAFDNWVYMKFNKSIAVKTSPNTFEWKEFTYYKERVVERLGKGFMYDSILFPQWQMVTEYIDNEITQLN